VYKVSGNDSVDMERYLIAFYLHPFLRDRRESGYVSIVGSSFSDGVSGDGEEQETKISDKFWSVLKKGELRLLRSWGPGTRTTSFQSALRKGSYNDYGT
jgi:hypothetical protein